MQRIKIDLPEFFSFTTPIKIRITDLNYGGHVGNDIFLSLAHEARVLFLQSYNASELNFFGTGLIMADAAIEYKSEVFAGEILQISVAASNFDKIGFDIYYLFEKTINDNNAIVAKIKTGMMCYDYANKKRATIPIEAINQLKTI